MAVCPPSPSRPRAALLVLRGTLEALELCSPQDCPCLPLGPDTKLEGQDPHPSLPSSLDIFFPLFVSIFLASRESSFPPLYRIQGWLVPRMVFEGGKKEFTRKRRSAVWLQGPWIGVQVGSSCFLPPCLGSTFPRAQASLPASKAPHSPCA